MESGKWKAESGKWKARKLESGKWKAEIGEAYDVRRFGSWQQARHLVNEIYSLTVARIVSLSKDFGLTDQVQTRPLYQVMSNVAEGFETDACLPRRCSVAAHCASLTRAKCARCSDVDFRTIDLTISSGCRTSREASQSRLESSSQAFCGRPRDGKADSHEQYRVLHCAHLRSMTPMKISHFSTFSFRNLYFSSMSTVIEVDDVWKKYRLGIIGTGTLRHDFERWWHRVRGKPDPHSKVDQQRVEGRR